VKIGVDMTAEDRYPTSGIAKVVRALYTELTARRPDRHVIGFHRPDSAAAAFPTGRPNLRERVAPIRGYRLAPRTDVWLQVGLPVAAMLENVDVLHCPANNAPRMAASPYVVTIHDLIPLEFPAYAARDDVKEWARKLAGILRRAGRVVVGSEHVRRLLRDRFPEVSRKVRLVAWGPTVTPRAATDADTARLRIQLDLPSTAPYLVCFGSPQPHKNVRRLIDAWCGAADRLGRGAVLLIVGLDPDDRVRLLSGHAGAAGVESCLLRGPVPEDDLPLLLQAATALVYPSLAEGFGLPIVEAFTCGCPVIASSAASLPEVAGDAADYFDPLSIESLQAALCRVVGDRCWRDELAARAVSRAKQFDWQAAVETFSEPV
jgi:glycosyltransferase involved in cell wall biosynthesis